VPKWIHQRICGDKGAARKIFQGLR
jgi:hypothetical protein